VTGSQQEEHELVPENISVLNGSGETLVQWIVVPLKQGVPVSIEVFKNLPQPEGADSQDNPQPTDYPSESIGTFPSSGNRPAKFVELVA
jgi:hypothetical protein